MKAEIEVDMLDATPHSFALVADVRYRNAWRVKLGLRVIRLGVRLLRSRLEVEFREDLDADAAAKS